MSVKRSRLSKYIHAAYNRGVILCKNNDPCIEYIYCCYREDNPRQISYSNDLKDIWEEVCLIGDSL